MFIMLVNCCGFFLGLECNFFLGLGCGFEFFIVFLCYFEMLDCVVLEKVCCNLMLDFICYNNEEINFGDIK